MTYSNDLKLKILRFTKLKKFTYTEIMNLFDISKAAFYKIIKESKLKKNNKKSNTKRHRKITNQIENFIVNYVVTKINFNYNNLIIIITKKYNVTISKTSIYRILAKNHVKKKRSFLNKY